MEQSVVWNCKNYKIEVAIFMAKHNPLPKDYTPETEWIPLWTHAGVEAYASYLNEKFRNVRIEEILGNVVAMLDLENFIAAMTILKSSDSDCGNSVWYRYFTDPKGLRNAIRVRVALYPV